ncbi:MAG: ribosome maturation factor RimM [Smithellaceae bacterium]|nr:ribosome maturation factor RimM [Smithellaceae bacterium]NLX52394.1 16S rRNA processing protein RimM [Deltaproteobacteria bacterium]
MDLFVFGEIVKTRGLRGCLKALSFLESQEILTGLEFIDLEFRSGRRSRHPVKKIDSAGKFLYLEFQDVADVEAARALIGCKLLMPRERLGALPDGEYYWQDIIGLEVYTTEGLFLGHVASIFPTGSNDVYVCRNGEAEYLIPAIVDAVVNIDLASRRITVNLLEGLKT